MQIFTGAEPSVGRFTVGMDEDVHYITVVGQSGMLESSCPVEDNLGNVYAILRRFGFTMAGYQTADILQFPKLTPVANTV